MKQLKLIKYTLSLLLGLMGCFSGSLLKGQVFLEPITNGIPSLPDTVLMGDTIDFNYFIVNKGPTDLVSPVILTFMQVNGVLLLTPVDSEAVPGVFPVGDTVEIGINDFIVSPSNNNNGGANVVVIWPTAPGSNAEASDSSSEQMYVKETVSRTQLLNPFNMGLYPNPATLLSHLVLTPPQGGITEVGIYDINGKALFTKQVNLVGLTENKIALDLAGIKPGLLFVKVENDIMIGSLRLIKLE